MLLLVRAQFVIILIISSSSSPLFPSFSHTLPLHALGLILTSLCFCVILGGRNFRLPLNVLWNNVPLRPSLFYFHMCFMNMSSAERVLMEGSVNPAFQEDSEEESEMRSGGYDSTLAAQQCVGLQDASTARGEASCCPSLCNTCPA